MVEADRPRTCVIEWAPAWSKRVCRMPARAPQLRARISARRRLRVNELNPYKLKFMT